VKRPTRTPHDPRPDAESGSFSRAQHRAPLVTAAATVHAAANRSVTGTPCMTISRIGTGELATPAIPKMIATAAVPAA
jgi:hypothetical protein